MIIRFSQKWAKQKYEKRIRELIKFVKGSRSCPDLLVKIFMYKTPQPLSRCFRGNYRNIHIHGLYLSDQLYKYARNITSIITLRISPKVSCDPTIESEGKSFREFKPEKFNEELVELFAHEFKHYLDMHKLMSKSKWKHWEVRAERFAENMLAKWKQH